MNELLVWWVMWVNSNYDVLIMTITLLVVGGLVLEVIKLNKRAEKIGERADWNVRDLTGKIWYLEDLLNNNREDQVKVNVHLAEDITGLQKKIDLLGKVVGELKFKRKLVRK